ncbi:iron complex outermembrane recepter protein [bacterium A37T11]|nr:iron complex outermembrane recepter protein [bacterium A37T11]
MNIPYRVFSLFFALLYAAQLTASVASGLRGTISDLQDNRPLTGATVSIPDLKRTVNTDNQGRFEFKNLPNRGHYIIEVSYIGYKSYTQDINIASPPSLIIKLERATIETQEVVVTGTAISGNNRRNSTATTLVDKNALLRPAGNLIDALSNVPGVSQVTTGLAISKPVIRGLGYNRVVTLDNGIKQEGQQWGDEHGIEIDQYKADRVEVLRGAASLIYGSDALGGVINLLEPLPVPEGGIRGEVLTNYSSNNGETASSLMLTGNENGFVWMGRGTYKNAYSFKTPIGYFPNSGFNETDFNAMLGLNKSWGYSHLNFSSFRNNIGFYDPALDENGNYVDEDGNGFRKDQLKSRDLDYPKQDIRHYKLSLNNNFVLGESNLKVDLAFQQNQRRELEDGPDPSLYFNLNTYTGDVKYYLAQKNGWQTVFGLSGEIGNSENRGTEFLIPAYDTYGAGAFAYIKKSWENSTLNGGIRYDYRKNKGHLGMDGDEVLFEPFENKFFNLSGALGFTHQFSDALNFKANAGTAFRAPNPAELGSNGRHEGTFRYEVGNPNLSPERSYQADASLDFDNKWVHAGLSIYNNYIHNFIYASNNHEFMEDEGDNLPVYRYGQVNANLYGAEASLILHPVSFIHFENTFGYTHAQNATLGRPLSFIPAAVLRNELRYEPTIGRLQEPYVSVGIANYFAQNRVDEVFETPTNGYTLLNAGIGTTVNIGHQPLKLYIAGNNLLNKKYYDALSRFKPGRLDQTQPGFGIYNPGRNISLGLYVPLLIKKG